MSAVVLRELVAKLGLQVDDKAYQKADKGLKKIKDDLVQVDGRTRDASGRFVAGARRMANAANDVTAATDKQAAKAKSSGGGFGDVVGKYLGAAAVGGAIAGMVELASSADETQNVLEQVFGPAGQQMVNDWAEVEADRLGRSYYALVANTAALGAMLQPMTGSAEKAQEMSQRFATLAVDLASFFNSTDDEALAALKSGIAGESEPLKRFGIVLQDATLEEYAHKQGITKKVSAMNVAEKTALRYNFILAATTKATDDAARTADGFANSSRALKDRIRDLATDIGRKLLPYAKQVIVWANQAVSFFAKLAQETNLLGASLTTLGLILLATFGPTLVSLLLWGAALAAVVLLVDELITTFQGGNSYIRDALNAIFGEERTAQWLVELRTQWAELIKTINEAEWSDLWDRLVRKVTLAFDTITETWRAARRSWLSFFLPTQEHLNRWSKGSPARQRELRDLGLLGGDDAAQEAEQAYDEGLKRLRFDQAKAARVARESAEANAAYENQQALLGMSADGMSSLAPPSVSAAGANMSPAPPNITINNTINMSVAPDANAQDAARAARRAAEAERRGTADALRRTLGR